MKLKPHNNNRKPNSPKGQATVEFALILIVLLAVLYGIIEISRLLFVNAQIENAAREGAHYVALHPKADKTCVKNNVIAPLLTGINTDDDHLQVEILGLPVAPGVTAAVYSKLEVKVNYTWTSLVNFVPDMKSFTLRPLGPLTLSSTGNSLVEASETIPPSICSGE